MARRISPNNGATWYDAQEIQSWGSEGWIGDRLELIASYMDDDTREQVHAELAPCTPREFICRYLALAAEDLVLP